MGSESGNYLSDPSEVHVVGGGGVGGGVVGVGSVRRLVVADGGRLGVGGCVVGAGEGFGCWCCRRWCHLVAVVVVVALAVVVSHDTNTLS